MDVCTEQVYQRRITELTCQLAERDATIVDIRSQVVDYQMDCCPHCGGRVRPLTQPSRKLQQVEIP